MQVITMHLRAASVKATPVDEWNQQVATLPALTRGMRAELVLKLLDAAGEPMDDLPYASWDFAVANDWDTATAPQLRVTEGITVSGNEIHVPLTETNTEELIAALGRSEQQTFGCELAGFEAGETAPGFLLQFDIIVRNRRADAGTGTPAPVGDGSYSAAQIRALLAARLEVQLSDDGGAWHEYDPAAGTPGTARWFRFRNVAAGHDWSDAVPLLVGPRGHRSTVTVGTVAEGAEGSAPAVANSGDEHDAVLDFTIPAGRTGTAATVAVGTVETAEPGESAEVVNSGTGSAAVLDFRIPKGERGATGHESYVYVAYAARSDGAGFSLTPTDALRYRAEIVRDTPLAAPTAADFAGARWVKYLGDDSTIYGEVLVADADTSVSRVSRIVFENARIARGIDGEVIVRFKEAGVTEEEMSRHAVVNGRTRLSSWTNGGGSPSAIPGLEVIGAGGLPAWTEFETHSTFIG